jgi:hypothetical protein
MTFEDSLKEMIPDVIEYNIDGVVYGIYFNWDRDLYDLEIDDNIIMTADFSVCLEEIFKAYIAYEDNNKRYLKL